LTTPTKPRILIVDDQPINIKLLQRKLERQSMDISVAYNGRECLEIAAKVKPDLILLDVMMPEMDGIETCRQLKADPELETVPIIFITAKSSKEGKLEGLGAGAVDYITKPIDLDEMLARVHTQLRLQAMFRENMELQERLGDARRSAAVGAITQGITHNLNNLLGVVVGYLDLIKSTNDCSERTMRSIGLIDNSVNRMVNIIRQLGTIANEERHQLGNYPLADLLENSINRLKAEHAIQPQIDLVFKTDEAKTISTNAEVFEMILGKLLINAWECYPKETPESERSIRLEADMIEQASMSMLEIKVIDAGPGLDPSIASNAFEPFVTTKTSVGRGMGLTTARHTARSLQGNVTLKTNPEGGLTLTLTLPA
jgi:DNA-binding response OmpR family regulator